MVVEDKAISKVFTTSDHFTTLTRKRRGAPTLAQTGVFQK